MKKFFFLLILAALYSLELGAQVGNAVSKEPLRQLEQLQYDLETADYLRHQGELGKARKAAAEAARKAAGLQAYEQMARAFHLEGLALMSMDQHPFINKGLAISKFQKSQKVLIDHGIDNQVLASANMDQISNAQNFYLGNDHAEDFINTVKIDLDSLFDKQDSSFAQLNTGFRELERLMEKNRITNRGDLPATGRRRPVPGYGPGTDEFLNKYSKKIEELVALQKTQAEKEFLENTEAFVIPNTQMATTEVPDRLNFDLYWPMEKEAFEKEMRSTGAKVANLAPESAKEKLLLAFYKQQYDSLMHLRSIDSITLVKNRLELQKQASEAEAQRATKMLQMMGSGSVGILAVFLLWAYNRQKKNNQLLSRKNQLVLEEKKRSEDLLLNILPAEVAKELKNYGAASAHKYDNVSVLFSDFQNFSQLAERLPPVELVSELDFCFRAFDRITEKYHLEKIKTIGDAYMCAGGLHTKTNEHVSRIIKAALEMQRFLAKWKADQIKHNKPYLEARIGIHTGPVVAGVVGAKKFAYDIWGDTVNVAAQMENYGHIGKVNISGATYRIVKEQFCCEPRDKVKIKNNKEYEMYFVRGLQE